MRLFDNRPRASAWLAALMLASAGLAQAGPSRPFKASLEIEHRVGRLTRCPGLQGQPGAGGTFTGTGHATHLGTVEMHADHCIRLDANRPDKPVYVFEGHMHMTAANGDQLDADYSGQFTRTSEGAYVFDGYYYVTGGTGRFDDSDGSGVLFGTVKGDFPSQSHGVSMSAEGRIRY